MKYILLFLIFLFTLNCSINKVSNTHGFSLLKTKFEKITVNKNNKNDIKKIIGPPSSVSNFDDIWFYIERKKTNQSIYKLGKKKIYSNNIIIIEFNKMGIVSNKEFLDLNKMNDISIAEKITEKKFSQNNTVYNILSSLREKLNAASRRKK